MYEIIFIIVAILFIISIFIISIFIESTFKKKYEFSYNKPSQKKMNKRNIYEEYIFNNQQQTYQDKSELKRKTSYQEKIEKGKKYEEYVAKYFQNLGFIVWEHGKEKGKKDKSIDLIIKKDKIFYFVQCKNWENWKITHKEIKATRTDIREYLQNNKKLWGVIKNYNTKILYVTSKKCLTKGAQKYIEENKNIIEYMVIPMPNG